jgi:hypothetical protein
MVITLRSLHRMQLSIRDALEVIFMITATRMRMSCLVPSIDLPFDLRGFLDSSTAYLLVAL